MIRPIGVFVLAVSPWLSGTVSPAQIAQPVSATVPNAPVSQGSEGITTIHARTNLVIVDVVVTDSKQNPVHNLSASDFSLFENNKPQQIKSFEEHSALPAADLANLAPTPKLPPGLFTNKPTAPSQGPVNILLLDYLNTPLSVQPYARQQLIDYLNKTPPGTRIAIFAISTNLVMLQGFTSDPAVLKAALTSKKGTPQASDILTSPVNGGPQGNTVLSDNFSSIAIEPGVELANILRAQALETAFEQDLRAKITLGAFDSLSRYLVGIPGRKNVIWFSGSFPLSLEPNPNLADAFDSVVRNDDEIRKTDNLLTRAQVAVYPVDARGVFSDPSQGAMNGASTPPPVLAGTSVMAGDSASADANSQMDFLQQTAQEHETMFAMAEDTGGHAFVNTNNLTQAVKQAIENGSNYYTLTYSPSNPQWDGRFRAIKVKVEQSGVKLSYRKGYYADDPNDRNRVIAQSAALTPNRPTTMVSAMIHGGPDPTEILFTTRIRPASAPPQETALASNAVNPKVPVHGPFQQYGVDLTPDPRSVNCPAGADGNHRCALEVATYVYDHDGTLLVTADAVVRANVSPANYAKMKGDGETKGMGLAFHQQISVPVHGEYYLRTAIHDLVSDKVGAVEVPVAAVARLKPLTIPPPPPPVVAPVAAPVSVPVTKPAEPATTPN